MVSDFRERRIGVMNLILFVVGGWITVYCREEIGTVVGRTLQNAGMTVALGGMVGVYLRKRWKGRRPEEYIGWGDLCFLPALWPWFGGREFLYFLTATNVLALAGWGIYYVLTGKRATIPWVGVAGIVFMLYVVFKFQTG